jgi:dolichol kinase
MLAIPDAVAGYFGKRSNGETFMNGQKTYIGSVTFFLAALFLSIFFATFVYDLPVLELLLKVILSSVVLMVVEAVSVRGVDNVTVPLSAGAAISFW